MKIFSCVLALVTLAAEDVTAKATVEPEKSNWHFYTKIQSLPINYDDGENHYLFFG